jgi:DNA-binding transcriptional MerR regulator
MSDRILLPRQVAELLKVSPRTLEAWRRKGVGPPHISYSSRCVRYREKQLRSWLASRAKVSRK